MVEYRISSTLYCIQKRLFFIYLQSQFYATKQTNKQLNKKSCRKPLAKTIILPREIKSAKSLKFYSNKTDNGKPRY